MDKTITDLAELQSNLEWLLHKDLLGELVNLLELLQNSLVNAYGDKVEQRGEDCTYVLKTKDLFDKLQKDEIITKISTIAELIEKYKHKVG